MVIKNLFNLMLVTIATLSASTFAAERSSMCVVGPHACLTSSSLKMGHECLCTDKNRILRGTIMAVNVGSVCKVTGRDQQCLTGTISEIGTPCICDVWVGVVIN